MSGFTPGPWEVDRSARVVWGGTPPRYVVAHSPDENNGAYVAANMRLIAAAPDLLAASADFLKWFETFIGKPTMSDIECSELTALRTAISKATGESNA